MEDASHLRVVLRLADQREEHLPGRLSGKEVR